MQVYGNITKKIPYHMTILPDHNFTMYMQCHFSEHISTLPDDSSTNFVRYHLGNFMAVLPNTVYFTFRQGRFVKHMTTLQGNYNTI